MGMFPLHQIAHVGVSLSRGLKLFGREIIFKVFQHMWSRYLNVTDRRTDRQNDCSCVTDRQTDRMTYHKVTERRVKECNLCHSTSVPLCNHLRCVISASHTDSLREDLLQLRSCSACYERSDQRQSVVVEIRLSTDTHASSTNDKYAWMYHKECFRVTPITCYWVCVPASIEAVKRALLPLQMWTVFLR